MNDEQVRAMVKRANAANKKRKSKKTMKLAVKKRKLLELGKSTTSAQDATKDK